MNKLLLKLVMLPSGLWQRMGADKDQLRAILHAKLLMDDRKPLSFGANKGMERKRKKKKDRKNTSLLTMLLSFFMGMIYVFPILMCLSNTVIGLAFFYTMFIFFFTFTLITDFANVLVDTKDKLILFPRPINDRTIMMSRLLYIAIYLFRLAIPMSIPAWIVFGIIKGWIGALFFPFPVLLLVFIVLFVVCGLYILMLRVSKPGKFKEVLNYFQIGFSVVFFATYMLSSRMIDPKAIENVNIEAFDVFKYIPTYWIATSWSWIDSTAIILPGTKWLSIFAILFPIVSLWLTVKYLAPQFIKSLVSSENTEVVVETPKRKVKEQKNEQQFYKLANLLNKSDIGKAGFIMTWLQTNRSRTFKMRVLPTFAYVPVYFFYILLNNNKPFAEVWSGLPDSKSYIALLYMTTFVIMQGLAYITMSDQYKAAWVYYSAPIEKPGEVILGAFKAMWVKYFLPFMFVIGAFTIYVWGTEKLLDIVLATVNITFFTVAQMYFSYRILPFSMKEQVKDNGVKTIIRVLLTFLLIGVLGVAHYLADVLWWLKLIFLVLTAILLWMFYDSLRNTPWNKLKTVED